MYFSSLNLLNSMCYRLHIKNVCNAGTVIVQRLESSTRHARDTSTPAARMSRRWHGNWKGGAVRALYNQLLTLGRCRGKTFVFFQPRYFTHDCIANNPTLTMMNDVGIMQVRRKKKLRTRTFSQQHHLHHPPSLR